MTTNAGQRSGPPEITHPEERSTTVQIAPEVSVEVPIQFDWGPTATGTIDIVGDGELAVTSLILSNPQGVSGTDLRRLPIDRILSAVLQQHATIGGVPVGESLQMSEVDALRMRVDGPTEEHLQTISRVYAMAEALHIPPAQYVGAMTRMPMSTVGAWLRRARDLGLLAEVAK